MQQQKQKLYSVSQGADLLKISTVTMYKKIKNLEEELEGEVEKNKRGTFLSQRAIDIIKNNIYIDVDSVVEEPEQEKEKDTIEIYKESILDLKSEIESLREQLKAKDIQLERKDNQLENFQVLLKNEQERTTLLLEDKRATETEFATTLEEEKQKRTLFSLFSKKSK
jgi:hypothetical protein